jgi:GAF domain-containing protein
MADWLMQRVGGVAANSLFGGERMAGALVERRKEPGKSSPAIVRLVQTFADQLAIALENARLFDEIAQKGREFEIANQHNPVHPNFPTRAEFQERTP